MRCLTIQGDSASPRHGHAGGSGAVGGATYLLGRSATVALAASGVVVALWLTRLMRGLLYSVSPTDPVTFAAVPLMLVAVALIACYIPARRALRVDPVTALRSE
jgi:ABC-type antimicrobial peptide transport system permease subunit